MIGETQGDPRCISSFAEVTMNNSKYSKGRPFSFNGARVRNPKNRIWTKLRYNVGLIILAGVSALLIMFGRDRSEGSPSLIDDLRRMVTYTPVEEQHWNYSSYSFTPNVSDWDDQRSIWVMEHQDLRPRNGGKPRVLMVSSSAHNACDPKILSHLLLRSSKNKVDYCRMHDIEFFYNLGEPDPEFSDWWVKVPVIRMLMLQNPQVEWIWWLDADAVITDLSFEPPYEEIQRDNLVLYGEERNVFDKRTWAGLSTANFMIRNCQWSLDLLDAWASMGTVGAREDSGYYQSKVVADRPLGIFPGDDQSGLVALLSQDKRNRVGKQRWAPMVKLVKETDYQMTANWTVVAPKLEQFTVPGHENLVPFVTHFSGCLPSCNAKTELSAQFLDACVEQLGRAFDFADNQVYKQFGFEPRKLGHHSDPYAKTVPETTKEYTAAGEEVYRMPPRYSDWDERRRVWMQLHPPTARDEVILVSGSAPKSCSGTVGNHYLLRGLKNLVDYSRRNDVILFYNNAAIDKNLTGWWSKLPLLKMLMIDNPGTEWIWWLDSDAVITDIDYRLDFARYNASGYNVVMYGNDFEVYEKKKYNGINTGNFLIRNCQWSLDLFDRWASFGATPELRASNEDLLNNFLSNRSPGWDADDQCVLVYLLILERQIWGVKAGFEGTIIMSGSWEYWTALFRDEHPREERPFVTHFAGCKPCYEPSDETSRECVRMQGMTYNFVDNQVLEPYGLRHLNLNTTKLMKRSDIVPEIVIEPQTNVGEDGTTEGVKLIAVTEKESKGNAAVEHKVDKPEKAEVAIGASKEEDVLPSKQETADIAKQKKVDKSVEAEVGSVSDEEEDVLPAKTEIVDSGASKKKKIDIPDEEDVLPSKKNKIDVSNEDEVDLLPSKKKVHKSSDEEEVDTEDVVPSTKGKPFEKAYSSKNLKKPHKSAEEEDDDVLPSTQEKANRSKNLKKPVDKSDEEEVSTSTEEDVLQSTRASTQEKAYRSKNLKKVHRSDEEEVDTSTEEEVLPSTQKKIDRSKTVKKVDISDEEELGASTEEDVYPSKRAQTVDRSKTKKVYISDSDTNASMHGKSGTSDEDESANSKKEVTAPNFKEAKYKTTDSKETEEDVEVLRKAKMTAADLEHESEVSDEKLSTTKRV